ncbi:galectin-4-like [Brachyhypopomus gauderio]|uniref:galectin-4-like n=1 Tax=Brachyhypopomus gauderio TaxID=698409 RepID=UPI004042A1A1
MAFVIPQGGQTISSPCIPYIGPIYGGLRPGMYVYIHGEMHHHISRFHVNLQCGEFEGCDVAFHFNPRIEFWDKVIFNSYRNGSWEGEETVYEMPFHRGRHFEVVICVTIDGYEVNVNGQGFYFYQHRMPVERVCVLEVGGDVIIDNISIIGGMQGGMGGFAGGMGGGMGGGFPGGMGGFPGGMGGMAGGYPGAEMGGFSGGGMWGGFPGGGMGGMAGGYPGGGMGGTWNRDWDHQGCSDNHDGYRVIQPYRTESSTLAEYYQVEKNRTHKPWIHS